MSMSTYIKFNKKCCFLFSLLVFFYFYFFLSSIFPFSTPWGCY